MSLPANNLHASLSLGPSELQCCNSAKKSAPLAMSGIPGTDDLGYVQGVTRKSCQLIISSGRPEIFWKWGDSNLCDVHSGIRASINEISVKSHDYYTARYTVIWSRRFSLCSYLEFYILFAHLRNRKSPLFEWWSTRLTKDSTIVDTIWPWTIS